ncbi:MAG: hypothetical protein NZ937_01340 [Armatimonadetes bacterium]|nr:hypothetical protein [Armatimonadota bacterium]
MPFWSIAALPILILLLWLFAHHRYGGRSAPLIAIAIIGAVGMLTELTILLVFQSRFGTLYQQVALLFALFMLGLAFGACLFESWHKLRFTLSLPVLAVLTGLATLSWCGLSLTISLMPSIFVAILCWIFMVLIGCFIGAAFPATVFALENLGFEGEKSVGWAYGYDLVGGAIGAFLIGSIILPLWGTTDSLSVCSPLAFCRLCFSF